MATVPTATIIPGPKFTLTPQGAEDANGLFMLGNSDPENGAVGAYQIDFRMSLDWQGSITVLARNGSYQAGVDDIGLIGPWPFRAFYLNGAPVTPAMYWGPTAVITGTSSVLVPASGMTIGLAVICTVGSCAMYYLPLLGQTAV